MNKRMARVTLELVGGFGVGKGRATTSLLSCKTRIPYDLYWWFRVANSMQSFVVFGVVVTCFSSWSGSNAASRFLNLPEQIFQVWSLNQDRFPKETQGPGREYDGMVQRRDKRCWLEWAVKCPMLLADNCFCLNAARGCCRAGI